jgi:hypothetical protein
VQQCCVSRCPGGCGCSVLLRGCHWTPWNSTAVVEAKQAGGYRPRHAFLPQEYSFKVCCSIHVHSYAESPLANVQQFCAESCCHATVGYFLGTLRLLCLGRIAYRTLDEHTSRTRRERAIVVQRAVRILLHCKQCDSTSLYVLQWCIAARSLGS